MRTTLCISVRILATRAHGRNETGEPEWPPSPLRLLQALVAASAGRWNERTKLSTAIKAIEWLECQSPPRIISPSAVASEAPVLYYVPDNTAEQLVPKWKRGQFTAQVSRTEKLVRPVHFAEGPIHFLYELNGGEEEVVAVIREAARSMTHLGWGIDVAVGDAVVLRECELAGLSGVRWRSSNTSTGVPLRVPRSGTLEDLMRKHADFLERMSEDGFRPVPPLKVFDVVQYHREDQPIGRPFRVFELRTVDGERDRHPPSKLIHVAGMVRHLAIQAMKVSPPRDLTEWDHSHDWVEAYVAGHATKSTSANVGETSESDQRNGATNHRQLSYLPLPSIGHQHVDSGIRRVMVAAPIGDDAWLEHVARHLAGQQLIPDPNKPDPFPGREPPLLIPVKRDSIARLYTAGGSEWHSVTPVILPGHDDHRPAKTRKLIEKALAQSGVDVPCEFEWSAFSRFAKSFSAHQTNKQGKPQGYIRPDHLLSKTAVHLNLRFHDGSEARRPVPFPGPLVIGAGRHCGFGLMAAIDI